MLYVDDPVRGFLMALQQIDRTLGRVVHFGGPSKNAKLLLTAPRSTK
jgi:hypothetical protein